MKIGIFSTNINQMKPQATRAISYPRSVLIIARGVTRDGGATGGAPL
jgi:hypothetical protein